jgi:hypothetical protein
MERTSRTEGNAFIRRGEAWSEASELAPGSFRVRMGGAFRGAWLASLASRLAEQQISIDHIHARRTGAELWIAELHLLAARATADPLEVDYSAFAEQADAAPLLVFELESYRLLESRDYGGTLMLTLEAADSLGLLGSLLSALAQLGLFPDELHIETRDGRAYDCIWLSAAGGVPPTALARDAALQLLRRSCQTGPLSSR